MQKTMIFIARAEHQYTDNLHAGIQHLLRRYAGCAHRLRYAIADADVQPAQALAMISSLHPKDAMISVEAGGEFPLTDFLQALAAIAGAVQAYGVEEKQPLPYVAAPGRVPGMCQVALLKRPASLSENLWLEIWQGSHTRIAIDTQSTFSYRQNKVITAIGGQDKEYPLYDAIVEEQFPAAAMTSRASFFNAENDEAQYKANEKAMIESCLRFVDFTAFECVPMSEYQLQ